MRQCMTELNNRGESLSIMCVGDNGLGKSTLLSNLLAKRMSNHTGMAIQGPTQKITETSESLEIDGFPFRVKLIDTPGYGDFFDLDKCFNMITRYVDKKMEEIYDAEHTSSRRSTFDWFAEGIDVVLYFIAPHRLKKVRRAMGLSPNRGCFAVKCVSLKQICSPRDSFFFPWVCSCTFLIFKPVSKSPLALTASGGH